MKAGYLKEYPANLKQLKIKIMKNFDWVMNERPKTVAQLQRMLDKTFEKIILCKGDGYFYIYSGNDATELKISGLYTTSIPVAKVSHLTFKGWIESIKYVLKDSDRHETERMPVFENIQ